MVNYIAHLEIGYDNLTNGIGDTTMTIKIYTLGRQTNGQRISSRKELGIICGLNL